MKSKRAIIVHGWDDTPEDHWIPWLRTELEATGYSVVAPLMPDTGKPTIEAWVSTLNKVANPADESTYYVGHSIGCQTIMRHLEQVAESQTVGGAVLVAPWLKLANLSGPDEEEVAKPWIETPIDFAKVRSHLPKLITFFSDDDPWVSLENVKLFGEQLGAESHFLKEMKHIGSDSGMTQFPELLAAIRALPNKSRSSEADPR